MGLCKKDVTPLLMHWSYVFLALIDRYHIPSRGIHPHLRPLQNTFQTEYMITWLRTADILAPYPTEADGALFRSISYAAITVCSSGGCLCSMCRCSYTSCASLLLGSLACLIFLDFGVRGIGLPTVRAIWRAKGELVSGSSGGQKGNF